MRPIDCCFRSLKGKASFVNPVNKLNSLAYKVQQTFFVPAKPAKKVRNMMLLKMETYLISLEKIHNLSRNGSGQGLKPEEAS